MQLLIKLMILAVVTSSAYADMPALRGSAAADFVQELAQLDQCFSGDHEYDPCWIHTGCSPPAVPHFYGIWYCNDLGKITKCDKCRIKKDCRASDKCFPKFTLNDMWECVCSQSELADVENSEV